MAASVTIRQSKTILEAICVCERGQTIWIADAHRDDGKRFVVHADEKLTAFLELAAAAVRTCGKFVLTS